MGLHVWGIEIYFLAFFSFVTIISALIHIDICQTSYPTSLIVLTLIILFSKMFKFSSFFFNKEKNICEKKYWIFKNMYLLFKLNDIVMKVANSILKILFWEQMCKVLKHFCVMGQSLRPITPKKKGF